MHARLLGDYICFPYLFFFLILDTSTGPSQSDELQSIYHENTNMFLYTLIQQLAKSQIDPNHSVQGPFRSHLAALNAKHLSSVSWTPDVDTCLPQPPPLIPTLSRNHSRFLLHPPTSSLLPALPYQHIIFFAPPPLPLP